MYIHQSHLLSFAKNERRVAEVMSEIEYSLKDLLACCDGSLTGLYLASEDAGMEASVQLWENALQHSPAFANPQIFPWTLANSCAGYLSRKLHLKGPNYTLVGNDALMAAFFHAIDDLESGLTDFGLVSFIKLNDGGNVIYADVLLGKKESSLTIEDKTGIDGICAGDGRDSLSLTQIAEKLEKEPDKEIWMGNELFRFKISRRVNSR